MAPGFNYVLQVSDILVFSLEYLGLSQLKILTILCSQSTTLAGGLGATHDTNKYTNQITLTDAPQQPSYLSITGNIMSG